MTPDDQARRLSGNGLTDQDARAERTTRNVESLAAREVRAGLKGGEAECPDALAGPLDGMPRDMTPGRMRSRAIPGPVRQSRRHLATAQDPLSPNPPSSERTEGTKGTWHP
jgi:hypothetical protein